MLAALAAYQRGFAGRKAKICYAMKANSSLAVLQVFAQAGCGFDIVSGGELERVLAAGGDPPHVIFSGVGKTRAEMRRRWTLASAASMSKARPNWSAEPGGQRRRQNARRSASASTPTSTPRPTPTSPPA
jgi:hypothetical protein